MAKSKTVTWGPKAGKAATWAFYPSAKVRKAFPSCDREYSGLDCQDEEVLSLAPLSTEKRGKVLAVTVIEGRVELADFDTKWRELGATPEDATIWDIRRIVEDWSSED